MRFLHHCIKLEPGAELTVLETGPAAARFSKVMEVEVGEGARFHHVRGQGATMNGAPRPMSSRGWAGKPVQVLHADCKRPPDPQRMRDRAGRRGRRGACGRAAVGDGDFHHDDTVFVTHAAERCESRQVFKKVLMNGATGVFQGKILVKPGAQKTDGYQISQSLLLDEDSQFLANPSLRSMPTM